MPLPMMLAPVALKAVPYALDYLSPEARAERKRLKADTQAMERGQLGTSGAQQQEIVTRALQNLRSTQRGTEAAALRARAAGGPTVGGETSRAIQAMQEPLGQTAVAASAAAQAQSAQQEQARAEDVRRRIAEKRARRMEVASSLLSTPLAEEAPMALTNLRGFFGKGGK